MNNDIKALADRIDKLEKTIDHLYVNFAHIETLLESRGSTPEKNGSNDSEFCFSTNSGPWWLKEKKLAEYEQTYAFDIRPELRKAAQWLKDHPHRRKTKGGMSAFLTKWLNRASDSKTSEYNGNPKSNGNPIEEERRRLESAILAKCKREGLGANDIRLRIEHALAKFDAKHGEKT